MITKELMKKEYISINKNESVSRLIGQLKKLKQRAAVVFDKKKYIGVTSRKLLLRTKFDPAELKISTKMIKKVPVLSGEEDIEETARLLYTADSFILPVMQKNTVMGIIDSIDIVNQLKEKPDADRKIKEIMTPEPILIKEDGTVGEAIAIMWEKKISRIPVVDNKGKMVNIASIADILEKYYLQLQHVAEQGKKISAKTVKTGAVDIGGKERDFNTYPILNMTGNITVTGKEDDTVSDVLDKMNEFDISSLVIVRDNEPVGIVTIRDLLKLFMKDRITY